WPRTGALRDPHDTESRRLVQAGVARRGTHPGAAGVNGLATASLRRGHARYQRARAESDGPVAQWERITLAVWGSRVRIPPGPPASEDASARGARAELDAHDSTQLALNRGGTAEAFRPLKTEGLFIFERRSDMASELRNKTERYSPSAVEAKWRERWDTWRLDETPDVSDR